MTSPPSSKATFYQYTLLQKITYNRLLLQLYIILACLFIIGETLMWGPLGLLYGIISFFFILWIHFVVIRSVLLIAREPIRKKWRFRLVLPWIGFLPEQYISYPVLTKIHRHLTWLAFCIIAILYPWSPISFVISAVFWHLWFILPRLLCFFKFRKQPKNGIVKLTQTEMLYYKQ